ncbi:MAG TPA: hypothetical protein VFK30_15125 [Anaerolineae bacterium]|nr:hypothetical protein [Anaerolineae bacterium]
MARGQVAVMVCQLNKRLKPHLISAGLIGPALVLFRKKQVFSNDRIDGIVIKPQIQKQTGYGYSERRVIGRAESRVIVFEMYSQQSWLTFAQHFKPHAHREEM